jgi:prophage antirepressor
MVAIRFGASIFRDKNKSIRKNRGIIKGEKYTMENAIQIYENKELGKVRTILIDGEPYFVGKDVAEILGYKNPRKAIGDHIDEEDKGVTKCDTLGGEQELTVINESGLYSLILSSKLPAAKKFKRWVTSEVLPEIRKTGSYSLPDFNDPVAAARAWADEVEKKRALLVENNQLKDDLEEESEFRRKVFDTDSCITFTDAAKIIKPHFKKFGRKKLLEFLKDIRAINQNNTPYANQIEAGRFTVKEKFISPDGYDSFVKKQAYLTQKGIEWVIREYREYLKNLEEW